MSDSLENERERIRERKARELRERLESREGGGDERTESPAEPISIRDQGHFASILESHSPVLVDCYADWCGPCQMLEPTIDALAAETDAAVAKLDVDANPQLTQQLGARGVPTLLVFADGEPAERFVGVQDRATLEAALERHR
ncbi:thioredoxin family protein [Natrononativus amylolyticus]|uniref:thioredoxin family protein n=1 Tax=Natrononativus amylolyticus TaxID=2963434 RepID=UPI0020CE0F49|nr:thioredoxin family protein [Natrononativus amylolyticus]